MPGLSGKEIELTLRICLGPLISKNYKIELIIPASLSICGGH